MRLHCPEKLAAGSVHASQGLEARREMAQQLWGISESITFQGFPARVNLFYNLHQVIQVALGVNPAWDGQPNQLEFWIDHLSANGIGMSEHYRADLDREVPVSGTKAYDAVRLKKIDDRTTEGVLSHGGRVFGFSRRVLSEDGKTMTITFRREEPGDMVNNFAVYAKAH